MTVTSLALRVTPLREPNQSLEDYQANIIFNESQARHDTVVGCIGLANAMVQTILCLRCHGKVQRIRKTLQEFEATARSSTMQVEYQEMSGYIDSTSGAISAGALFITKQPIASAVGLFVGYAVLIYQTRDSIVGDQRYAKKKDLPQLADLIIDFWAKGTLVKCFEKRRVLQPVRSTA
ncbi:hypothetical protein RvY_14827 [Ramazzottius varieornatus]|uniref:Uncharacterized protein n=1 Tax=Ramazzottius varieornatus TaxID=947166 RepID=A0A1D1VSR5_RAMVA|nr:hypothetical protein RvY_14827 [Ramazzottius varieornatus]